MYFKIYVPTENSEIIERIAEYVSKIVGGCTIIPNCCGFWINSENQLVKDKITIVEAYITENSLTKDQLEIYAINLASYVKRKLKQDCVAYCIDNQIYFY